MTELEAKKRIDTAIKDGDTSSVLALIEEDKSRLSLQTVFGSWLHIAAKHGQLELLQRLLELGLDINVAGGIAKGTPLLAATSAGQADVVRYLISQGAQLNASEPERNPLFAAIDEGYPEIARILIENGIDTKVMYRGSSGKMRDAHSYAMEWGRTDIAKLIEGENAR